MAPPTSSCRTCAANDLGDDRLRDDPIRDYRTSYRIDPSTPSTYTRHRTHQFRTCPTSTAAAELVSDSRAPPRTDPTLYPALVLCPAHPRICATARPRPRAPTTSVLFAMTYDYDGKADLSRLEGIALLAAYICYLGYIVTQTIQ